MNKVYPICRGCLHFTEYQKCMKDTGTSLYPLSCEHFESNIAQQQLREEFLESLKSLSNVDLLLQGRNENYIQWLEEKVKKLTTHNSNSCGLPKGSPKCSHKMIYPTDGSKPQCKICGKLAGEIV